MKKILVGMFLLVFGLCLVGCESNSFEIEEGIYICDSYDYYGELELKKISENEFVNRSRSGEVVFRDANGNVLATLSVTQSERELSVSHSRIELPLEGGESRSVTINAVGEYSISSDADWFTVNHNRENTTFTVVADANQDNEDRTGTITVALLGDPDGSTKYVTIDVVQYAGDVNFDLGDFDEDKEWN